jgi:hypothetical protein
VGVCDVVVEDDSDDVAEDAVVGSLMLVATLPRMSPTMSPPMSPTGISPKMLSWTSADA